MVTLIASLLSGVISTKALGIPEIMIIKPEPPQPVGICVTVAAEVTPSNDFGKMRIKFANEEWQETTTSEIKRTFCTNKYEPGVYKIRVEAAELGDNAWSRSTVAEADYELKDISYFYPGQVAIFGTLRQVFPAQIGDELYIIRSTEHQRWLVPNKETAEALCLGWGGEPGNIWNVPDSELLKISKGPDVPDISTNPDAFWEFRNRYFLPCDPSAFIQSVATPTVEPNSQGTDGGLIAFVRNSNIFMISPDGTGERQLTSDGGYSDPAWSPDGSTMVFARLTDIDQSGGQATYIGLLDVLTLKQQILVEPGVSPFSPPPPWPPSYYIYDRPKWSPDGQSIYFHTFDGRASGDRIWKVDIGGSILTQDVFSGNRENDIVPFDISPTDGKIVYVSLWHAPPDRGNGLTLTDENGNLLDEILPVSSNTYIDHLCWSWNGQRVNYTTSADPTFGGRDNISWIDAIKPDDRGISLDLSQKPQGLACSPYNDDFVYVIDETLIIFNKDAGTTLNLTQGIQPSWGRAILNNSSISGNAGTGEVTLSYVDGDPKSVLADSNGDYSFTVPHGWSGAVTPSKPGYTFDPESRTYASVQSDQVGQDFAAIQLPPQEIELTGLEVTQAIQNLRNDIILIKDKRTFVRAHVRSASGTINSVTAILIGRRPDGRVAFQLHPSNIGKHINVKENPSRLLADNSFYFKLPMEELNGTLELEFQGVGYTPMCSEPDNDNNLNNDHDCKVQVTFSDSPALEVKFIDFMWLGEDGSVHLPSRDDHNMVEREIETVFPIPDLKPEVRNVPVLANLSHLGPPNTDEDFTWLNLELNTIRFMDGCVNDVLTHLSNCQRFYVGILVDPPEFGTLGGATRSVPPKYNYVAAAYYIPSHSYLGPAHELGHALGRCHTDNVDNPWTPKEICFHDPADGAISKDKDENSPDSYYGFDTNAIDFFGQPYVNRPYKINPVYKPNTPDLMSYAPYHWPSAYTYPEFSRFVREHLISRLDVPSLVDLQTGASVILVRGVVNSTTGTGSLDSAYVVESRASLSAPESGSYTLRFEDSNGRDLASYSFEPDYISASYAENAETSQGNTGFFVLPLPWYPNATRIVLLHNGQELDSRTASSSAPTIHIDYPNGGESLSGSTETLSWYSTDLDGDTLEYVVQYSTDGGATWETLATDWTSTTYELNLDMVTGSDQGLLRVLASDGFHTAQDQSDATFSVAKHAPWARIDAPVTGSLFVIGQTIILEGSAFDNEDGYLEDEVVSWRSNIDGVLGIGQSLSIIASTLTEGIHTVTLNAQDSDGQTGSTQVIINVYRDLPTLPASLSTAPGALNFLALKESKQTVGETVSIRNDGDGPMHWSASADQNWILLSAEEGIAPTDFVVKADPAKLAVGEYTGTITITASDAMNSPQTIAVTLQVQEVQNSGVTWVLYVILVLAALMLITLGVTLPSYLHRKKVSSITRLEGQADPVEKYCKNCGTRLPKEGRFCPQCGTPRGRIQ